MIINLVVLIAHITWAFAWIEQLDPFGKLEYQQLIDNVEFISDATMFKRDNENSTLDAIVSSVGNSGLVIDLLYEIASSDTQIKNLVNYTTELLNGNTLDLSGFNISLNTTSLLNGVLGSDLIQSTAAYLLINDTNNDILANRTGIYLSHNLYVAQILNNLGAGQDLTVDMIAGAVKNTKNLNPRTNGSSTTPSKQTVFGLDTRDDTDGSAQAFLNNLVNGVIGSQLVSTSLVSILDSVNRTGIVGPIAMDLIQNDTILEMVPKLLGGLYNNGVFNNMDLNKYFQESKKTSILSNGLQYLLTSPTWEPPVARLLKSMDDNGVYQDIEDGLYGPDK